MRAYDKKGYRFLEADLERSLEGIRKTWLAEPAIEAARKNKSYAKLITKLLNFKTRGRERVLWQTQYGRFVSVWRLAFGDACVATFPKRLPTRSYLESEARTNSLSAQDSALIDKLCEAYLVRAT